MSSLHGEGDKVAFKETPESNTSRYIIGVIYGPGDLPGSHIVKVGESDCFGVFDWECQSVLEATKPAA